jgi:hypothetical protein
MADVKPLILDSGIIKQVGTGDTIPVANGGTGATTLTDNGVLIGNGTSAVDVTSAGTTGQVLVGVTGGNPAFGSSFIGKCIAVAKTGSETITSSTALQDDNHFTFSVAANERWVGRISFPMSANGSGGFKYDITAPSGASGSTGIFGLNAYVSGWVAIGTGFGATATATNATIIITFDITNGSNAGSITLRWAQNASFGTGTTVKDGGILMATRIS